MHWLTTSINFSFKVNLYPKYCSICLNTRLEPTIKINCGHFYHIYCLQQLLLHHKKCPVCRRTVRIFSSLLSNHYYTLALQYLLCYIKKIKYILSTILFFPITHPLLFLCLLIPFHGGIVFIDEEDEQ